MAAAYQVNINISSGTSFSQTFTLTNPDLTPLNITGYKFTGALAKHNDALVATKTTSKQRVYRKIDFSCRVVNGVKGEYEIYLSSKKTAVIPEGKYVYNVVSTDLNGNLSEVVSGLAFCEPSFASPDNEIHFDGGGAAEDPNAIVLNGGNAMGF